MSGTYGLEGYNMASLKRDWFTWFLKQKTGGGFFGSLNRMDYLSFFKSGMSRMNHCFFHG